MNSTFVHVFINPKLKVMHIVVATKSDSFSSFSHFLVCAVDQKVILPSLTSVSGHKSDIWLDWEHESCQVSLEGIDVFNWSILVSSENISLFLSFTKVKIKLTCFSQYVQLTSSMVLYTQRVFFKWRRNQYQSHQNYKVGRYLAWQLKVP